MIPLTFKITIVFGLLAAFTRHPLIGLALSGLVGMIALFVYFPDTMVLLTFVGTIAAMGLSVILDIYWKMQAAYEWLAARFTRRPTASEGHQGRTASPLPK